MADKPPPLEMEEEKEENSEDSPFPASTELGILRREADSKWSIVVVRNSEGKMTARSYFPAPGKTESDGTEEEFEVNSEILGDKSKFLRLNHLCPELKLLTVGDYSEYRTNPEAFKVDTEVDIFTESGWEVGKVMEFSPKSLMVRVPISTGFSAGIVSHSQLVVLPKGTMTELTGWKPPENLLVLEALFDLTTGKLKLPGGNKPVQVISTSGLSMRFEEGKEPPETPSKPPEGLS